jgi:hypothetical protein
MDGAGRAPSAAAAAAANPFASLFQPSTPGGAAPSPAGAQNRALSLCQDMCCMLTLCVRGRPPRGFTQQRLKGRGTAMKKLRIVILRFGTARQKMVLE